MSGVANCSHPVVPLPKSPFVTSSVRGAADTMSWALALVAVPSVFVATARKRAPFADAGAAVMVSVAANTPL